MTCKSVSNGILADAYIVATSEFVRCSGIFLSAYAPADGEWDERDEQLWRDTRESREVQGIIAKHITW